MFMNVSVFIDALLLTKDAIHEHRDSVYISGILLVLYTVESADNPHILACNVKCIHSHHNACDIVPSMV